MLYNMRSNYSYYFFVQAVTRVQRVLNLSKILHHFSAPIGRFRVIRKTGKKGAKFKDFLEKYKSKNKNSLQRPPMAALQLDIA